ncbi:MAG: mechanosensitive ion channel protein MscS [Bacteroides sp. SM23_62_1]|nr:MAG: mechanosensitive ion channel protein MscS [Bacteroides sp. SM23_62_1]
MNSLFERIQEISGLSPEVQRKLIGSLVIILILWFIRFMIIRIVWRRTEIIRIRYQWRRTTNYFFVVFILLFLGAIWFKEFRSIGTFLGLLSAGIAIALKDPLVNMAGWLFILARKPFKIGDRIEIDRIAGDVIDIHIFRFTLLELGNWVDADQTTGRIIHIPNGKIFTQPVANYHAGFNYIWNEIPVLVTFESNWQKAKKILLDIVNEKAEKLTEVMQKEIKDASRKFMIHYNILTPTVYTTVKDCGVMLTIRYLCQPRNRRGSEEKIWENILAAFHQCADIDFAYPTQRFYNNLSEGKQARGSEISQ